MKLMKEESSEHGVLQKMMRAQLEDTLESENKSAAMTDAELAVNFVTLLQAGVDTTSSILRFLVGHIASHPRVQDRLREEIHASKALERVDGDVIKDMPFLKAVVRETHRLTPTAPGTVRLLKKDMTMVPPPEDPNQEPYTLKKGSTVLFSNTILHGDHKMLFCEPDEVNLFLPERWMPPGDAAPGQLLESVKLTDTKTVDVRVPASVLSHPLLATPFGVGPRMCIGARLAQNEIASVLVELVGGSTEFSHLGTNYEPGQKTGLVLAPRNALQLKIR